MPRPKPVYDLAGASWAIPLGIVVWLVLGLCGYAIYLLATILLP